MAPKTSAAPRRRSDERTMAGRASTPASPQTSHKRPRVRDTARADEEAQSAMQEAKRIIAAGDLEGGAGDGSAPLNLPALLHAFEARSAVRNKHRVSMAEDGPDGGGPLEVDWALFRDWPEGLPKEEGEMRQYYKYLKFIHLEHETKIRFITEIVDDLEADPPREAIVYTPRDVKEKEAVMFSAKALLKEAKQAARSLRSEIDSLADEIAEPYRSLSESCAEAKSLMDECMDLELDLVKIKNEHGLGSLAEVDVNEMELETLPPVGTLTTAEAERFCERQEEELVMLEESNEHLDTVMSRLRADAKATAKDIDKLSSDKHAAERAAREAQALGVGGRKRDKQVEAACNSHSATLSLLKTLIGLRRIDAVDANTLDLAYISGSDGCELGLRVRFDQPGGRLVGVELHHPSLPPTVLPPEEQSELDSEFATLNRAIQANDVAAVVMEAWSWAERRSQHLLTAS